MYAVIFYSYIMYVPLCRNGSTIVEFVVIYQQQKMTKVVVGDKVRKEIIETGKLGGYPVTGGVVKGI